MTPIDLRIKYKFDTGYTPIYRGVLTHNYIEWLEKSRTKCRIEYKNDTGLNPMFIDGNADLTFTKDYKEWLEEKMCKLFTFIESLKNE